MSVIPLGDWATASSVLWIAAVVPLTPLTQSVKFEPEIAVYVISSVPIKIVPEVAKPVVEVRAIVVAVAFIPALRVVLTPSEVPSLGDL